MTRPSTWKGRERKAARTFGSERQIGSGSGGRADQTCSDSVHPTLYIETKTHKRHAARTLYEDTKAKASKEKKTPVLMLATTGKPGFLVCVHSDDLEKFTEIVTELRRRGSLPGDGAEEPIKESER